MNLQKSSKLCKYYFQGRCKFGNYCRYSHQIIQCFLVRHAQSQFNYVAEQSKHPMNSEEAKYEYQLNPKLIDCRVTEEGNQQIQKMRFPKQLYLNEKIKIDVIFVSPLLRALYTALQMIRIHNIDYKQVIVLPLLTEVLSKICDFCDPIQNKIVKFTKFNFKQFQKFPKEKLKQWQDSFVAEQFKSQIDQSKSYGQRYLKVLQNHFPTPLESSNQCFYRSLNAIQQMREICLQKNYKTSYVISHNRILKYISGRDNGGKGLSFQNCEIRLVYI